MTLTKKKNRALTRVLRNNKRTAKANETAFATAKNIANEPAYTLSTEIPTAYNDTYLRAIPKDPQATFVYWQMPNNKAVTTGVPENGKVLVPNEKAAWLVGKIAENTKPKDIPQTIPSVFETQSQTHSHSHSHNADNAAQNAPPAQNIPPWSDGSSAQGSQNQQQNIGENAPPPTTELASANTSPWPIPPTRPCEFETNGSQDSFTNNAVAAVANNENNQTAQTQNQSAPTPSEPSALSPALASMLAAAAEQANIIPGSVLTKRQYAAALDFLLSLTKQQAQDYAAVQRAMSSGIFYNANADKSS